MDISAVKISGDFGGPAYQGQTTSHVQVEDGVPTANTEEVAVKAVPAIDDKVNKKTVNVHELTQMTEAFNKFVEAMDANIRFTVHEKTKELMVQVVDQTNNKVLKEFPPHEFLDTLASIQSYIGILLDEKV